ncbi:MAG: hypothetical protein JSS86_09170 [Cyanobacteria bacterium SZAS LIN-2]|nr:hypothetical protein [Cyanobacteria bacterium SZAS LIN-3]MBS1996468.1 hypothetical protein [Cyanobacteria bacterium SZAS LIN-2]MBS2009326.1 hypothetical protein [Cyanobacteria bacterium SZAS TMP-1]
MSISWGKKQRYKFNSGVPLTSWAPPACSAVYALTYKQDPAAKPKSHTVLYFGHAEDLSQQAAGFHKHVLDAWVENGGQVGELFVFVYPMDGATRWQRSSVQEQLVSEYYPQYNRL